MKICELIEMRTRERLAHLPTGAIKSQIGKYRTVQHIFEGTNGISVVVETEGRNAGKAITAFVTGSKP
jgi:hypothetical protein